MKLSPGNAQHIGDRAQQQDSFAFSDLSDQAFLAHGGFLAVVCDGMGGLADGQDASQAAVTTFLRAYQAKSAEEGVPDALQRALREANREVYELACSRDLDGQMGTTLIAAVVAEGTLHWISVGDSRIYLARRGEVTLLTEDHVYANQLRQRVDRGELSADEAACHPERASLTSFLGRDRYEEVCWSLRPLPLDPGDRVLLCSDGLYRALSEPELAAGLAGDPQEGCERLLAQVLERQRNHQDNVTVVAIACDADSLAPTTVLKKPRRVGLGPPTAMLALAVLGTGVGLHQLRVSQGKPVHRIEQPSATPVAVAATPATPTPATPTPQTPTPGTPTPQPHTPKPSPRHPTPKVHTPSKKG